MWLEYRSNRWTWYCFVAIVTVIHVYITEELLPANLTLRKNYLLRFFIGFYSSLLSFRVALFADSRVYSTRFCILSIVQLKYLNVEWLSENPYHVTELYLPWLFPNAELVSDKPVPAEFQDSENSNGTITPCQLSVRIIKFIFTNNHLMISSP